MLNLGKSLLSVSFQPVLTCLKQDKVQTKANDCVRKLSSLSFPGDFRACYFAVCSNSCLYKKAIWAVQKFAAENKLRPTFHQHTHPSVSIDHLWLSITFFLFPFHVFFISYSCQVFPTSPMSLVSAVTGTSTCVACFTAFRRQSVASSWQLQEPWGKGLRPPSWADVRQQLGSAFPSSSSSCNRYPLVRGSRLALWLWWIQLQAFCSLPRNDSSAPTGQPRSSTLLITGSAVSPSTCPHWE